MCELNFAGSRQSDSHYYITRIVINNQFIDCALPLHHATAISKNRSDQKRVESASLDIERIQFTIRKRAQNQWISNYQHIKNDHLNGNNTILSLLSHHNHSHHVQYEFFISFQV